VSLWIAVICILQAEGSHWSSLWWWSCCSQQQWSVRRYWTTTCT